MIHNVTEGLGIAAPIAEGERRRHRRGWLRSRSSPARRRSSAPGSAASSRTTCSASLFFAIAVGAALQVVVEVGRFIARRAPGGLGSGYVIGGFLAGIAVMYATGLIAG